ncbi:MAG: hypothetical protein DMG83_19300 [Acidobacteria bacterium]|nr:MAG: hypothetical protein DMG83_19300 [Acidobacteriota bacterium]
MLTRFPSYDLVQAFAPVNADRAENLLRPQAPPTCAGFFDFVRLAPHFAQHDKFEYELDP